jgi:L-threonylcarbamoyladenylate synthase
MELEQWIGPLAASKDKEDAAFARSPGQMARHYAPSTPVECVTGSGAGRVRELGQQGLRVGLLAFGESATSMKGVVWTAMPDDARAYAAMLYAALHQLDAAGLDRIVVELPPATDAWLAIHDRLRRAAALGTGAP